MSYLHCPTCSHAFNLAVMSQCPFCPVPASLVDPAEDIVAAADALARAMARATPAQRDAAAAQMGSSPVLTITASLVAPHVAKAGPSPRLLTRLAESLVDRAMPALVELRDRARKLEPKVIAMLPRRAGSLLRRVRALAA
ncbi:MAG: hypothetical protein ABI591_09720 [Kofleriaceae bacterium]